jgi:pimeloyl-ACP methyl ester carboxylesterase
MTWIVVLCGLVAGCVLAAPWVSRHVRAAHLLLHLWKPDDAARDGRANVETRELTLTIDGVALRAREYVPGHAGASEHWPGIVLVHGVHPRGIDEPRMIGFARALASAGVAVLTPEIPELAAYRIEASTTERIASLAREHARRVGVRAVGVMGISFAGGLSLIAATHARDADAIAFVVCVGAHHDLMRLAHYYAGERVQGPNGEPTLVHPHPYGARVMLREHLERFFGAQDLAQARRTLDSYLSDAHSRAHEEAKALSTAGQATMAVLLDERGSAALSKMLLAEAERTRPALESASPKGKLATLTRPVFLVHGEGDPIIPSIETLWLDRELPASAPHHTVVTPLLRHAEFPHTPTLAESWQLVHFMALVLAEADAEVLSVPRTDRAR